GRGAPPRAGGAASLPSRTRRRSTASATAHRPPRSSTWSTQEKEGAGSLGPTLLNTARPRGARRSVTARAAPSCIESSIFRRETRPIGTIRPLASPNVPTDDPPAVADRPDHPSPRQLEPAYPGRIF